MNYESAIAIESQTTPGVVFRVVRMTFGRRLELARRVRDLANRLEFAQAGKDTRDQLESAILSSEIDKLYLGWGLVDIQGLQVDGFAAEPANIFDLGPEGLCREIIGAIKHECGLSEEERKN